MKELLVAVVVLATVCADLLQSAEMKQVGELDDFRPSGIQALLRAMARNKYLILAVFFMALSFFAFLKLLTIADLSYAVPVSALTIVIDTVLARVLLRERVDWRRWTGAALVAAGVFLISAA
ncbi:MAG TPA: DMT family transporter [Bryobacteraceae bacterium]|jgi:drug/metabolite transporter (DMT)-like permease